MQMVLLILLCPFWSLQSVFVHKRYILYACPCACVVLCKFLRMDAKNTLILQLQVSAEGGSICGNDGFFCL